jgi:hypothetical protein
MMATSPELASVASSKASSISAGISVAHSHWLGRLVSQPVDIAALAAFRILFGLLMFAAMVRFLAKGWVRELYVEPAFHFTYPGFEWVRPWPDFWMHAHFLLLAVLALGIAVGLFYRACAVLFFLGFTYVELLDQTTYLNHYYLITLLSGLLIFLPAHRSLSLDVFQNRRLHLDFVPAWSLNILRFQVAVVYIFAGLAKFNADWLFRAQPLRIWLAARSDLPLIGHWLGQLWVAYAASWCGAIFDTTIIFFLLVRKTRRLAYLVLILFHVATWLLFNIGMFPWIMIVAATLFFPADWPRFWMERLAQFARISLTPRFSGVRMPFNPAQTVSTVLQDTRKLSKQFKVFQSLPPLKGGVNEKPTFVPCRSGWRLILPLTLYVALQLALPLRPYFQSQPSGWTCSGFNCAWQVMIVEKTGYAEFYTLDPATGRRRKIPLEKYLTKRQEMMMAQDPFLIRDFARHLASAFPSRDLAPREIHVNAFATLNGRPSQILIDPSLNLAAVSAKNWITPLKQH